MANSSDAAEMTVVRRFLQPPAGSVFLFGPRGAGTSTWQEPGVLRPCRPGRSPMQRAWPGYAQIQRQWA